LFQFIIEKQTVQLLHDIQDRRSVMTWRLISTDSFVTTVFLAHHDGVVGACCLQVTNAVIVTGGMLTWSQRASSPYSVANLCLQRCGSVLSLDWTLSSFSALMQLVGRQEERLACESSTTIMHKSLLLGTGLTSSNLNWNIYGLEIRIWCTVSSSTCLHMLGPRSCCDLDL